MPFDEFVLKFICSRCGRALCFERLTPDDEFVIVPCKTCLEIERKEGIQEEVEELKNKIKSLLI